jgi:Raf kinase inhibitor-like YbhB/YbcL family protein
MRILRVPLALAILSASFVGVRAAQTPAAPVQQPAPPAQPQQPPQGGRGGGGRGGGGRGPGNNIAVMTLTSTAFPDGGSIPRRYTQAGDQTSPPLAWSNVPDGVTSFVLIVHDVDAAIAPGTDDTLHWMLWNVPAAARALPDGVPQADQLPDGTRQISATGSYYRGPGAATGGPPHHYVFELFALDAMINVPAVGAQPAATRAAVVAAMAGHVRGKAVYVGLFKR